MSELFLAIEYLHNCLMERHIRLWKMASSNRSAVMDTERFESRLFDNQ